MDDPGIGVVEVDRCAGASGPPARTGRRGSRAALADRAAVADLAERPQLAAIGLIAACAVLLLWPALLNGQYIVFSDTPGYVRGAARAFDLLLGVESEWSALYDPSAASQGSVEAATSARLSADGYVQAGRSIYYGTMIYIGALIGSMWAGLVAQSVAVATAIYIIFRAFDVGKGATWSIPLIALATPASFFASYLMPDIFAGVAILGIASLVVLWDRLRPWMRMTMAGLLAFSLLVHASHLALALALIGPAIIVSLLCSRRFRARSGILVAGIILFALAAELTFYRSVEAVYGHSPVRPPFLMARVLADGPGTEFLRASCPESNFVLCDHLDALPMDADRFLWSEDGIYSQMTPPMREALSDEQIPILVGALWHDPAGQARAAFLNAVEQFARFSIEEFKYPHSLEDIMEANMPPAEFREFLNSSLHRQQFPLPEINVLFQALLMVAAAYLVFSLLRQVLDGSAVATGSRRGATTISDARADGRLLLAVVAIVLLGVLLNAAITGALSTPHDRYQARVIWLVPMLALLVHAWRRRARQRCFRRRDRYGRH